MAEARGNGGGAGMTALKVIRVLLRLIFVVLLGIGLGAAAFYGGPALYRNFVEPVQQNSRRIVELEQELAQLRQEARQQSADQAARMGELEGDLAALQESLAALESRTEALEQDLAAQQETLDRLEALTRRVQALERDLGRTQDAVGELGLTLESRTTPAEVLARRLQLLRAMELVTRARLWLIQDNLGQAAEDVAQARDIVAAVIEGAPEEEAEALQPILDRLDQVLEDVRTAPLVAADDLEVAWELLVQATAP